jgi:hypothetical protein
VAVVAISLSTCGTGEAESSSKTSSGAALLPRDVIISEMTQEAATGQDESALSYPTGTRSVTYAISDGSLEGRGLRGPVLAYRARASDSISEGSSER